MFRVRFPFIVSVVNMAQMSRLGPPSQPPSQRALHERARRTRWLATMTVDPAARAELVNYAEDLDRQADAIGETDSAPRSAAVVPNNRRDAG